MTDVLPRDSPLGLLSSTVGGAPTAARPPDATTAMGRDPSHVSTPGINALCPWPHQWLGGYKNSKAARAFRTSNNWIVAMLTACEGFHNNDHDQQAEAKFAWTPWESIADLGLQGRRCTRGAGLGLATDVRLPKPTLR